MCERVWVCAFCAYVCSKFILISAFTFTTFANCSLYFRLSQTFINGFFSGRERAREWRQRRKLEFYHINISEMFIDLKIYVWYIQTHMWTEKEPSMLALFCGKRMWNRAHWMLPKDVMIYVCLPFVNGWKWAEWKRREGKKTATAKEQYGSSSHERSTAK